MFAWWNVFITLFCFFMKINTCFSHYQDTLQTGSIVKLRIMINIDIHQSGEKIL